MLMQTLATLFIAICGFSHAKECLQPNYIAEDNKIFAVDPSANSNKVEIRIRGVNWSGMENDEDAVLMGLWGREPRKGDRVINGTTIAKVGKFLKSNGFNSVRLPLNANALLNLGPMPNMNLVHSYANPELAGATTQLDFLRKLTVALGEYDVSVLLDIHTIAEDAKDPYWYEGEYPSSIASTKVYRAIQALAEAMCNDDYWNVLGIDLKNEPYSARWDKMDGDIKKNWRLAAEALGNMAIDKCSSWLVFVEGVGSIEMPQDFHKVSTDYDALYGDWHGANFRNALTNPIKLSASNKLVYSPHTYAHGAYPQNYFYDINSTCSSSNTTLPKQVCHDYLNGVYQNVPYHKCTNTSFSCDHYTHLGKLALQANDKATIHGMFGFLATNQENSVPIVMGEFGGVYGKHQPHQTIIIDAMIKYIATSLNGGYFWALNPESEYFLEDSTDKKSGYFPRTHYGILQLSDWEKTNDGIVEALANIPSTSIPCYSIPEIESSASGRLLKVFWSMAILVIPLCLLA